MSNNESPKDQAKSQQRLQEDQKNTQTWINVQKARQVIKNIKQKSGKK